MFCNASIENICRGQILHLVIVRIFALLVDYDYFACTLNMIRYNTLRLELCNKLGPWYL